jgi:hypothetical protein
LAAAGFSVALAGFFLPVLTALRLFFRAPYSIGSLVLGAAQPALRRRSLSHAEQQTGLRHDRGTMNCANFTVC